MIYFAVFSILIVSRNEHFLECSIPSEFLNLQYFKRESYISVICQAIDFAVEGRKADADTHLAGARSQNTGTGILGNIQKIKDSRFNGCLFLKSPSGSGKRI